MGNDGGVLQNQRRFVVKQRTASATGPKKDSVDGRAATLSKCAISSEPLKSPIVADELGHLFNKESLIAYLLDKARVIPQFSHIRKLKDVVNVKASPNPGAAGSPDAAPFICPVTQEQANGSHPFVVVRGCGCMVSERAVKAVGSGVCDCPSCGSALQPATEACPSPFIKLCPSEKDEAAVRARMVARLSSTAATVASKATSSSSSASTNNITSGGNSTAQNAGSKRPREDDTDSSAPGSRGASSAGPAGTAAASSDKHQPAKTSHTASAAPGPSGRALHSVINSESVHTASAATATAEAERALAERKSTSTVFATLFSGEHGRQANVLAVTGNAAKPTTVSSVAGSAAHASFRAKTGAHRW